MAVMNETMQNLGDEVEGRENVTGWGGGEGVAINLDQCAAMDA
jgi:hypothetical protein